VHVSEVGNTIGGGFGGMKSVRAMHRAVLLEEPVKGDTLQEQFINTVAAYVNMLLLSSRFLLLPRSPRRERENALITSLLTAAAQSRRQWARVPQPWAPSRSV